MLAARPFRLGRQRMLAFLDEIKEASGEGVSVYLPPGFAPGDVSRSFDLQGIPPELSESAAASKQGAIILWGPSRKCLITPPFPIKEKRFHPNYNIDGLRSMLTHDYKVALILIRLGAYAVGVYQGQKLVASKVGTGLVHARHKKGGSSAARFARHREKQIEYFMTRVCGHVQEQIGPHFQTLDYVAYGGARTTILLLRKQCHFLGQLDDRVLPPLLDIPEPRQAVLETAIDRVWASSVTECHDNT